MKPDESWEASSSSNRWYNQLYTKGTLGRATLFRDMSIDTRIDTKMAPRLPAELVASNLFLLKRLGFAAKARTMDEYERLGLNPYHYAILLLLEGSAPETQAEIADALGYDRGTLVGLLD